MKGVSVGNQIGSKLVFTNPYQKGLNQQHIESRQHFLIDFPHRDTTLQIIPSSKSGYYKFLVKSDAFPALLYRKTGRNRELHDYKTSYP